MLGFVVPASRIPRMEQHKSSQRAVVRESGRQRRREIIEAALRVMQRDGLRAVTHRAVAREASVPLAATTYYFRDMQDLVTESFLYWSVSQRHLVEAFRARVLAELERQAGGSWQTLAGCLADVAAQDVTEQVVRYRGDRALEFAFLHEAARLPRLREVVEQQQRGFQEFFEEFHAALGSPRAALDAQISHSVLLGLEKSVLLGVRSLDGYAAVREVLLHYLSALLPDAQPANNSLGLPES
jgi:TetR/AcrR family transcriptional regulator, regulator of biofilm formation and stress response